MNKGLMLLIASLAAVAAVTTCTIVKVCQQPDKSNKKDNVIKDDSIIYQFELLAKELSKVINENNNSKGKEKIIFDQMIKIIQLPVFEEYVELCKSTKLYKGRPVMNIDDMVNDLNENDLNDFYESLSNIKIDNYPAFNIVEFFIDSVYPMNDLLDYYDYEIGVLNMIQETYHKKHAMDVVDEKLLEKMNVIHDYCSNLKRLDEIRKEIVKYFFELDDFSVVDTNDIDNSIPFFKANDITTRKVYSVSEKDFKIVH